MPEEYAFQFFLSVEYCFVLVLALKFAVSVTLLFVRAVVLAVTVGFSGFGAVAETVSDNAALLSFKV